MTASLPSSSSFHFIFFLRCSRWGRTSSARCHLFFFFLGVVDDDEPKGSSSFLSFFLRCKRWQKVGSPSSITSEQKNKNEKEANKKKVDVHLLVTNALVNFWSNVFYNTTSTTSSATPLQHHFCSIASTHLCDIVFSINSSSVLL
jgi:hypothetical protein